MLADNIVDASQQNEYAQTLKSESRRLGNLVENVLQYARLEKGRIVKADEVLLVGDFMNGIEPRLRDRAVHAGMTLLVETNPEGQATTIKSDSAGIERILFNLVDNACKYARNATDRRIILKACRVGKNIQLSISDFGPGVVGKQRRRLFQAFCKSDQEAANTAPGVGLGLALSQRIAKSLNGELRFEPTECGARFVLDLPIEH
jgi:K+-sensing histidine kinase KdpD